ncbi:MULTISPECIES: murein biosynthesis integral membrane protein MurJ [unclassified Sporosarcina]|uniref:murein biosynthesis integral membrane protein MurJ n=1 Tax=unclassified Sporosarcina TaxID=2647733 RepID=UPI000C16D889|nr:MULTISPECIES: lipid II flippase MurJ [unclassified Sporosarcina]PIC86287.1 murein biosynthesis protein MurJ [Sporosarcina sp. P20a]PIC97846.1 murein biosynthesis protein MurJ [Sporosarcina sp. P29]PID03169.1 murein biosynthesis protein MurJ [Sporosarcina sp. P30]PID07418.1 murein biosynthesis protein MurJ [Sporosarcina sp. P31]PID10611.1 murein biosynthesis protein MurJ [Sporosarcina sp. P32b]
MSKLFKIIGTVAIINIVARLFGFGREVVIGIQYGTSTVADAIATAYTIPNFIYLVLGGALTTAFISIYHSSNMDKPLFVRKAFTTVVITATLVTLVIIVLTNPILNLFFKDLSDEDYTLVRNLFLWMMPSSIVLVMSTWMSGLLNINDRFQLSSLAILLYNAAFVGVGFALTKWLGPESYGVGAMVSAILMGLFLFWGIKRADLSSLKPSFGMPTDIKRMWWLALPILFGGASLQFYFIIHRIAAGGLGEGAISSINYASKLTGFPQAILMTAVTTVIYPMLAKKEGEGDTKTVKALYKKGMLYMVALLLPATVFCYFLAEPLIRLVFGYGNFDEKSIMLTVPVFKVFALSMFFLAANTYVTRFYYAKGNSITPIIFSLISVFGINIGIIFAFVDQIGAQAIAYGTVISAAVNFLLLAGYARFKWKL